MEQKVQELPYIYKWRIKNKDRYLEISRAGNKKYYAKNVDKRKAYYREYYQRKKAALTEQSPQIKTKQ
jgi:hypothetical protein